nr:ATP-binding protein [Alkaliphilus metalliredigens]
MNNLIINSIDAIEGSGHILVDQQREGDSYLFRVVDSGAGIESDDMEVLFEPGFSTKYDPITGRMSTGIGLSHVKQIVDKHFVGSISAESSKENQWTCFKVLIPKENIEIKR